MNYSPLWAMKRISIAISHYIDGDTLQDAVEIHTAHLDREELIALVGYFAMSNAALAQMNKERAAELTSRRPSSSQQPS